MTHKKSTQYSLIAIKLLFVTSIITGCTAVSDLGIKTRTISKTETNKHQIIFNKKDYNDYRFNFIPQKNELILSTINNVYSLNLKTGDFIKQFEVPDSTLVKRTYASKNGKLFFLFSPYDMTAWNTTNWTLSKQLKAPEDYPNLLSGFSKDDKLLYFAGSLWSGSSLAPLFQFGDGPTPTDYAFSPDHHYLIIPDSYGGIRLVDLKRKEYSDVTYIIDGPSQVSARDDDSFYASYGATLDIKRGGYFPKELGVFAIKKKDTLATFSRSSKITCWINNPKFGLVVSLYNGDIYLLNKKLDVQDKWHMDDFVRVCSNGSNGEVWLGTDKTGVYKADLAKRTISHEYSTTNTIYVVKTSPNNHYLAISESITGGTINKVFSINQQP